MTDVFLNIAEEKMERRRMHRKKSGENTESGAMSMLRGVLLGAGAAIVAVLALGLLFSVIAYTREDPDSVASVLGFAGIYISAMLAGIVSARKSGGGALLSGALSGALLLLVLYILSVCFGDSFSSGYSGGVGALIKASLMLDSVLGAILGKHKSSRTRRRKRSC